MNKLKGFKLEILMKQRIYEYYFLIFENNVSVF